MRGRRGSGGGVSAGGSGSREAAGRAQAAGKVLLRGLAHRPLCASSHARLLLPPARAADARDPGSVTAWKDEGKGRTRQSCTGSKTWRAVRSSAGVGGGDLEGRLMRSCGRGGRGERVRGGGARMGRAWCACGCWWRWHRRAGCERGGGRERRAESAPARVRRLARARAHLERRAHPGSTRD